MKLGHDFMHVFVKILIIEFSALKHGKLLNCTILTKFMQVKLPEKQEA